MALVLLPWRRVIRSPGPTAAPLPRHTAPQASTARKVLGHLPFLRGQQEGTEAGQVPNTLQELFGGFSGAFFLIIKTLILKKMENTQNLTTQRQPSVFSNTCFRFPLGGGRGIVCRCVHPCCFQYFNTSCETNRNN